MRVIWIVAAWCALTGSRPAAADAQQATPPPAAPVSPAQPDASRLQFYGFIRQDVILDDSRTDSAQSPLVVLSEPAGQEPQRTYTMHPRLTRFGVNLTGPALEPLGGAHIAGRLEIDFQNGGRDSRAIPRYRHAYMTLTWTSVSVLVGQTQDLVSPLFPSVNADTVMWHAGNLGDRRPQVRATVQRARGRASWSLGAAAGLTGAVDQQDLDADGVRDGEAADAPTLQGRAGVTYPVGARRLGLGIWAHRSRQRVSTAIADQTTFSGHALGIDLELPLGRRAVLRGEAWTGTNLADIRGGIGQGINRVTGNEIDSSGGWVEFGGDLTRAYALFGGYTIDAPNAGDVPSGGRTENSAWFVANRFSAGRPFVLGIDYVRWRTKYRALPEGTDNRINTYVTYTF